MGDICLIKKEDTWIGSIFTTVYKYTFTIKVEWRMINIYLEYLQLLLLCDIASRDGWKLLSRIRNGRREYGKIIDIE